MRTTLTLSLLLLACGPGPTMEEDPDVVFPAPAREDGFQLRAELEVEPGTEVWQCRVGKLPGEGILDIARVQSRQNYPVHHADISVLLGSSVATIPPGVYDCNELYAQYPELMEQPILYGAQAKETEVVLPPGIVASVPAGLPILHEIHYVNTSKERRTIWARMNAYYTTEKDVQPIWGTTLRDKNLDIPPKSQHAEWTRCEFERDVEVLFVSMHTHQLGRSTEVYRWAGGQTGERIYRNDDWTTPLIQSFSSAPLKLKAGEGFEFRCNFENTTDLAVSWGVKASEEMCHFTYVFTPGEQSITCHAVASSDGVLD